MGKETDPYKAVIERIKNGDWQEFAKFGYLMIGTEHGQILYPHLREKGKEGDDPPDFSKLLNEVSILAASENNSNPQELIDWHRKNVVDSLLPGQPEESATDAQTLTHLYTFYGLSLSGSPITVSAIDF